VTRILYLAVNTPERAHILKRLRAAHLDVYPVSSVREALDFLSDDRPDATFLDADGLRVRVKTAVSRLRRAAPAVPTVLIVTNDVDVQEMRADALLRKPFTTRTFKARLRTVLAQRQRDILRLEPFTLDMRTRMLTTPLGSFHLTPREAALMREFLLHPGEVLSRSTLMQRVWGTDFVEDTRTLDVHVHWLRKKIEEKVRLPQYLITVHRVGYKMEVHSSSEESEGSPPDM